jgi:hypothetical protein
MNTVTDTTPEGTASRADTTSGERTRAMRQAAEISLAAIPGLTGAELREGEPTPLRAELADAVDALLADQPDAKRQDPAPPGRCPMNGRADTYEGQLAASTAELLPGLGTDERLELLGVMDENDMRASLAFIAAMYPQVFDFALVRDRRMTEQLNAVLDEDLDDGLDEEPYCAVCDAAVGIFIGHGDAWLHYRGEGTAASPVELFDAWHEPLIAWRPAGVAK